VGLLTKAGAIDRKPWSVSEGTSTDWEAFLIDFEGAAPKMTAPTNCMQQRYISVPFKINGHQGFSRVEGIAKFSKAGIVLEFETKILGLMKTGVKEVAIPISQILEVRFRKGFFKLGAKIEIRLNNFGTLNELPYKDGGVQLDIQRRDFERASEAIDSVSRILNGVEPARKLPEEKSFSVSDLFEEDTKELTENKTKDGAGT
jgi:hypothetical protein